MRKQDYYNYINDEFAPVREPMRRVMGAFGNAEKWFAAIKDVVLIDFSMPFLSDAIHALEHVQPERVDTFAGAIHSYGLLLEYPATPELVEDFHNNLDRVFEVCVGVVDEVDEALNGFIRDMSGGKFNSLALIAEDLQVENAYDRTALLEAWGMWDNGSASRSSFDSWCKKNFKRGT